MSELPDGSVTDTSPEIPSDASFSPDGYIRPDGALVSCGDGVIDEGELCDGEAIIDGASCASLGMGIGELRCDESCAAYDVSACCRPIACDTFSCSGTQDDGCGGTIDCGDACPSGFTCGGAGVSGRCGRPCDDMECPAGTSCNADGACEGAISPLNLDISVYDVRVEVSAPSGSQATSCADLQLVVRPARGYAPSYGLHDLSCPSGVATVQLVPGDYSFHVVSRTLGIEGDAASARVDGPTTVRLSPSFHRISGRVLMNGSTPEADSICSPSRTPRAQLTFFTDSGQERRTTVDCRNDFRFGPIVLGGGVHHVELDIGYAELAAIHIGDWVVPLPDVSVSRDDSNVRPNLRTANLDGILRSGGEEMRNCSELRLSMHGPYSGAIRESRYPIQCESGRPALRGVDLPIDANIDSGRQGANVARWSAPFVFDGVGAVLDMQVPTQLISGPLVVNGVPRTCGAAEEGMREEYTIEGAGLEVRVSATCTDGAYRFPETRVAATETTMDQGVSRRNIPVTFSGPGSPIRFDYARISGTLDFGAIGATCLNQRVAARTPDGRIINQESVSCDGNVGAFGLRTGPGDVSVTVDQMFWPMVPLGTLSLSAGDNVERTFAFDFVDDGDLTAFITWNGATPAAEIATARVGALEFSDADIGDGIAIPAHPRLPLSLYLMLRTGPSSSVWVLDDLPPVGAATRDFRVHMISGRVTANGRAIDPPASCESLGTVRVGNGSSPLRCDGTFGPVHAGAGIAPTHVTLANGLVGTNHVTVELAPIALPL